MKTLNLTFEECVRLLLMFGAHVGTRKDSKTRTLAGLVERIGIKPEELARYARPVGGDRLILDLEGMRKQAVKEIRVTREEARIALEMLDAVPLSIGDLSAWADALARKLEAKCG